MNAVKIIKNADTHIMVCPYCEKFSNLPDTFPAGIVPFGTRIKCGYCNTEITIAGIIETNINYAITNPSKNIDEVKEAVVTQLKEVKQAKETVNKDKEFSIVSEDNKWICSFCGKKHTNNYLEYVDSLTCEACGAEFKLG